jgi:hypothetical protein
MQLFRAQKIMLLDLVTLSHFATMLEVVKFLRTRKDFENMMWNDNPD